MDTLTKAKAPILLSACVTGVTLFLAIFSPYSAAAAISQSPLFIQNRVQPNIMLLLDDSGSMKHEVMLYNGATCGSYCYLDFSPGTVVDKRLRLCPGYNTLMYNPLKKYTPWVGENSSGHTYPHADINAALENPFHRSENYCTAGNDYSSQLGICDLITGVGPENATGDQQGAFYYPWTDSNDNGTYDDGECATNDGDEVWVSGLPADGSGDAINTQQNFANWFSYYRKGEYVMKRALSDIISESQERVGIATINQSTPILTDISRGDPSVVGTEIADLDTRSLPIDSTAVTSKKRLLRNLFRISPNGETPLRNALNNVGRYFDKDSDVGSDLFGFGNNQSPLLSSELGGACQQNFVIALSDGYWNGPSPVVGNADANSSNLYDGQSYADGYSNTLADVAMHYYKMDLSDGPDGLADKVPANLGRQDNNPAQHLVTYTVSFGLNGTIPSNSTDDSTLCYPPDPSDSFGSQVWPTGCSNMPSAWPEPISETASTIDDMLHAAWNGRGQFLSATNPQSLIDKLEQAISDITARTGSTTAATAVAVNSTNMRAGGVIYQAGFDPNVWSGQLFAYQLTEGIVSQTPLWSAHTQLSALEDPQDNRVFITYNGHRGIPFASSSFPHNYWNPDAANNELSSNQVRDLLTHAPYSFDTPNRHRREANRAHARSLIEYIRGSSDDERGGVNNGNLRPRNNNLLADIIHSAPVYVGKPNPAIYPDDIARTTTANNSYYEWATDETNTSRTPMIYVGTNGGGLHGFNASTGAEVFAYIPHSVFSDADHAGLHWLANQNYTHRYYADQTPSVGNVFLRSVNDWRTLLVSGLRGGGKGIFALDITTPSAFTDETIAAGKVLWEFTHEGLGYTFGQPTLAKLNNGDWAAIFGNGYNSDDAGESKAQLFIVNLSTGLPIRIIDTGADVSTNGDCDTIQCNGLSAPAVIDLNGDGIADRAYAGDLQGNLWAFDLSDSSPTAWSASLLYEPEISNPPQPITTRPAVTLHPNQKRQSSAPNTMVFFGTGQYINDGNTDIDNTDTQSFYGIWDDGSTAPATRDNLVQQQISTDENIPDDRRVMSNATVNYSKDPETPQNSQLGWYVDFNTELKERVIVNPIIFGRLVIFTTTIPNQNLCGFAGGSWLMVLDSNSGGEPPFAALDIDNDGEFNDTVDGHNVSGVRSAELYWQANIIQTGSSNSGTIFLPKDNEGESGGTGTGSGSTGTSTGSGSTGTGTGSAGTGGNSRLDQINIQGTLTSDARSSWSRFSF